MGGSALELEVCGAERAGELVPVVRDIFAAVFAQPHYGEGPEDVAHWLEDYAVQRSRPGFVLVLARVDGDPVGFAYGYTMTPDMVRWQKIVAPIADKLPTGVAEDGAIFTVMELGVLTERQGRGVGRALHDALLRDRREPLALLTVREDAMTAQLAYQAWSWRWVGHRPRDGSAGYDVLIREAGTSLDQVSAESGTS